MFSWLRKSSNEELPERVRLAIREQEDATERLVSWFQLAVVLTLGSLYFAGPKPDVQFDIIPWALAIYLTLTIVRVIWSHRAHLPDWSLAFSVLFDITLLMALIWSFHLRYDQPASFYLKAPTILYVFIFIALRALRFEARFVVLSGLVASLGWLVLVYYVVQDNPQDTMITRDYVTYMTSNSILIGAEIDKILSILMVAGIIAFSLYRAKRLLVRAVLQQTAAQDLSRFFAPAIAEKIKASDQQITPGSGEVRNATILNLDMRGFTTLAAEIPADEAMGLLSDYQSRMVPIIHQHGGSIDKFLGDGILATFGAAVTSDSHAADGVRALEACIEEAFRWQEERRTNHQPALPVNGSLSAGNILFGAVGDAQRLEFTVIGDAVNLCAKMEKANKDFQVKAICDEETYRLAKSQGYQPANDKRSIDEVAISGVDQILTLRVISE